MDWLWTAGSLVAGAILGVLADRLWSRWWPAPADYELWYFVDEQPFNLEGPTDVGRRLTVSVGDTPLNRPVVVTLYLWAAGSKDIREEFFDGGRPFEFRLGAPVIERLAESTEAGTDALPIALDAAVGTLSIGPGMIRPGTALRYRLLMDGDITTSRSNPIADTRVRPYYREYSQREQGAFRRLIFAVVLGVVGLLMAFVPAPILVLNHEVDAANVTLATGLGLFTLGLLVAISSALPSRQPARALRLLRRALGESRLELIPKPSI